MRTKLALLILISLVAGCSTPMRHSSKPPEAYDDDKVVCNRASLDVIEWESCMRRRGWRRTWQ